MEDNKSDSKFITGPGESKLEKDTSKKSLTHEEAAKEITEKTNKILESLNSDGHDEDEIEILKL